MTGQRKADANRANAQKSTGPKTAHGKARASRNAHQLGLSLPVLADPRLADQVEALAREIAGEIADDDIFALASRIAAEAQTDLQRLRHARHQLLSDRLKDFGHATSPNKASAPNATSQAPHKPTILVQASQQVAAIDRYEQRAWSRRRFAIRAFDVGRQRRLTESDLMKEIFGRTKPNNSLNKRRCPMWRDGQSQGSSGCGTYGVQHGLVVASRQH